MGGTGGPGSGGTPAGPGAPGSEGAVQGATGLPGGPIQGPNGAAAGGPSSGSSGAGGGPGGDTALGLAGGSGIARLLPLTIITSTATTVVIAMLLFGKRRRDEQPTGSDAELAAAAAAPFRRDPYQRGAYPGDLVPVPVPASDGGAGTSSAELEIPRWRRPSLLAARKADPTRGDFAPQAALTFAAAAGPATAGGERHMVRYRLVQVLDRPDELLGLSVATLDQGDEIEVLEKRGTYRLVLTPDGRRGWVHKMTLAQPAAPEPAVADDRVEEPEDFLANYLAARARA